MLKPSSYTVQSEFNNGTAVSHEYDELGRAIYAHNSAISAGVKGSAVFTDTGETIASHGEGAALVFDGGRTSSNRRTSKGTTSDE